MAHTVNKADAHEIIMDQALKVMTPEQRNELAQSFRDKIDQYLDKPEYAGIVDFNRYCLNRLNVHRPVESHGV